MGKYKNDESTRVFLKVVLVLIVIAIICILAYGGKIYLGDKKQVSSNENSKQQTTASANEHEQNEQKIEAPVEEEKDDEEQEQKEEEKNEEESIQEEVSVNDEQKAIELAKKEYGATDGVYFTIEHIQSNNVYIVSVRNKETTRDIIWYTVDVKAGTVK